MCAARIQEIDNIILKLNLIKHCEGGYFLETYRSQSNCQNAEANERSLLTSIYYLVTKETGLSYFASNKSDIILYHHFGDPLKIIFLKENGDIYEEILGSDVLAGHKPQVICPGNVWKAYDLMDGNYSLVGEAVAPGFDYDDMRMPTISELEARAPNHLSELEKYIQPK